MVLAPGIQQHVAGAGVESAHRLAGYQPRQVGDAADVQHHPRFGGAGKHRLMECGHQWCALATGGDVAAAKIGHHVDAAQLGQPRRRIELHGVAGMRGMADGLAVAADRGNLPGGQAGLAQDRLHRFGVQLCQFECQQLAAGDFVVSRCLQGQQGGPQGCRVRAGGMRQCLGRGAGEAGQHGVYTIHAGAGHQADVIAAGCGLDNAGHANAPWVKTGRL